MTRKNEEMRKELKAVSVSYYKPDALKMGGAYLTDIGTIKKIDSNEQMVMLDNGVKIDMEQIVGMEGV